MKMKMRPYSKVFHILCTVFIACFCLAILFVITVQYPLMGTALFLVGLLFLVSRWQGISSRHFSVGLFALSFLIHLGAVLLLTTPIQSDFALQYEASQQFSRGNFSFQETPYFQRWGYQTGLVIWQGTLLKLWNSPVFLRLVNCVISAGTNLLVYRIARDYFDESAARLAGLAYTFFLFPATLVTVLCNNIPSAFFLYLCLYLVMGKSFERFNWLLVYVMAGISLAIANALRPDAPLVLVPLLVYFVFRFVSKADLNCVLAYGKRFLALFLTFFVVSTSLSGLVKITGVNSAGLENNDRLWSVVVGTNTDWKGVYNNENGSLIAEKVEQGFTRTQAELQIIKEHLSSSPMALTELVVSKMKTFWWDRALGWAMGGVRQHSPEFYSLLEEIDRAMFTCALFLAGIGALALFCNPKKDFKLYLLPFIFFSTSCVYLVMEVQPRYAYVGQIAVFILMAGGIQQVCSFWKMLVKNKRRGETTE